ncbi:MAG: hypothetical protein ACPL06_02920 [Candidatus Anstonellales archaeon]
MRIGRVFILFLVFALLLTMGCFQKPEAHCCLYKKAQSDLCYFADKLAENSSYTGETNCKIWKENDEPVFCEVDKFNYSICSEWETKSCVEGCSGMLCGDFGKIGIPMHLSSEDLKNGTIDILTGQGAVFALLHAECNILKMTPSVERAMRKGILLNSFRFGIGNSFEEYDNYRYLFPLSDKIFNSYTATKDRYSNYFFIKKECREQNGYYSCPTNNKKYSSYYECEWDCRGINPAMVCSASMEEFSLPNSPFGDELGHAKHWYGGLFWADVEDETASGRGNTFWSMGKVDLQYPNDGRTANVGVLKFAKKESGLTAATVGIFGFKEIPTYYANVLPRYTVYSTQIFEGGKAEFECESGLECYSGICGKDVYKRSACIDALTNNSVECGCSYEYGQLVCKPTRTKSVPASDEPKYNVPLWDGETLGVSKAFESGDIAGRPTNWSFTAPGQISQPKTSIVNGKVMIFLSRDVRSTLGEEVYSPLPNDQATRWAILHYCQIVPKEWSGCQEGGTYIINFVENCMSEEYKEDIAVCYPPKFGLDGSSLGQNWKEICSGLSDEDFCISQGEGGECDGYAVAAIVIRKNSDGNFGKCVAENPSIKEYGWCEPATFNTIAVEHLYPLNKFYDPTGGDPTSEQLPLSKDGGIPRIDLADYGEGPLEDFENDYRVKGAGEVNKRIANYCPLLEILPPSHLDARNPNEWEGTSVGDIYNNGNVISTGNVDARKACGGHRDVQLRCDAYNLAFGCKDATRRDGDVYDSRISWPDYYPSWKYMKEKLTSYLIAGVVPVLYAEDDELYKTYYGCDSCYDPHFTIYKENATFAWKLLRDVYVSILYAADYTEGNYTYYAGDYKESASSLGPIIVVVGNAGERNSYEINLEKRASEVKEPCAYCMPALSHGITITGIGLQDISSEKALLENFDETYNLEMSDHLEGTEFCAREETFAGQDCNSLMENAGLFVVELTISPKVQLGSEEEKIQFYEYTVQKLSNISRKLVYRFGKPSLLVIKEIKGSADEYGMFTYLAYQKARLVNSGIIGIHFSNFSISNGNSLSMQKYCSVEGSAEISSGLQPSAFVSESKVSDECACVECDEIDMVKGVCNGYYLGDPLTGFQCSNYSGNQKWPEDCVEKAMCVSPPYSGTLKCRVYSGGEYSFEEYSLEEVMANPSLYSDLIASSKGIPKLCIENKTFSSIQSSSLNPIPILFSTSGNESKECVKGSTYSNFCGFDIPLKTRVSECWVE